jgi:hypothetical protein
MNFYPYNDKNSPTHFSYVELAFVRHSSHFTPTLRNETSYEPMAAGANSEHHSDRSDDYGMADLFCLTCH